MAEFLFAPVAYTAVGQRLGYVSIHQLGWYKLVVLLGDPDDTKASQKKKKKA